MRNFYKAPSIPIREQTDNDSYLYQYQGRTEHQVRDSEGFAAGALIGLAALVAAIVLVAYLVCRVLEQGI